MRRIKDPHRADPIFAELLADPAITDMVIQLIGPDLRYEHTKLNIKPGGGGEPVEWHQDWAFYPHSNDDILEVGVMLEDCTLENGPLMVIPGSHRGPVFDHHYEGYFAGAIDPSASGLDVSRAVPLTGEAGTVTLHHVRMVHGSESNLSDRDRPLLLLGYCAADAWPLRGDLFGDLESFNAKMVRGEPTLEPRLREGPRTHALSACAASGLDLREPAPRQGPVLRRCDDVGEAASGPQLPTIRLLRSRARGFARG